jgi:hypothetical protein
LSARGRSSSFSYSNRQKRLDSIESATVGYGSKLPRPPDVELGIGSFLVRRVLERIQTGELTLIEATQQLAFDANVRDTWIASEQNNN